MPGHGRSAGKPEGWTFEKAVPVISKLIETVSADPVHLVGILRRHARPNDGFGEARTCSYSDFNWVVHAETDDETSRHCRPCHQDHQWLIPGLLTQHATVMDLAQPFAMSQPAISRHLKLLEDAGFITRRIE